MEARVGLSASACLYCWYLVLTVVRAACPDNALEKAMKCTAGLGLGPPTPYNAFVETGQVEVAKQACRDRKLLNAIDCLDDIMAACQGNSDQEHFLRTMVDVDKSRACVQFFCSHLDEYEMHAECIATNHPALTRCVETERRNMQTKVKATGNMDFLIMATCKFFHAAEICSRRVLTSSCGASAADIVARVFTGFKPPRCDSVTYNTDHSATEPETGEQGGTSGTHQAAPGFIVTLTLAVFLLWNFVHGKWMT